jgi:MFS family permease
MSLDNDADPITAGPSAEMVRPEAAKASPNQVLAIVCVATCLANLDLFVVNVGLPNIARDFHNASLQDLSWILNGYAIAYAALLVLFGRLAERHRRDLSFLASVVLFTAASAACAMAHSVEALVAFRIIQAAGAALMAPTSLGLLLASFPADKRAGAVRTWTAIGGFAAALGPMVGGLLVTVSWRWIFMINVPIGLIAILIGWRILPRVPGHDVPRPNLWAALLVTSGIGALTFAIVKANDWGWASPGIAASFAFAVILLAAFVHHCLRSANPFVDPALFRVRPFTGAALVFATFSTAFGAMLLSIALWQQTAWGWSGAEDRPRHCARPAASADYLAAVRRKADCPLRSRSGRRRRRLVLCRRTAHLGDDDRSRAEHRLRHRRDDLHWHRRRVDIPHPDGGRHGTVAAFIIRYRLGRD